MSKQKLPFLYSFWGKLKQLGIILILSTIFFAIYFYIELYNYARCFMGGYVCQENAKVMSLIIKFGYLMMLISLFYVFNRKKIISKILLIVIIISPIFLFIIGVNLYNFYSDYRSIRYNSNLKTELNEVYDDVHLGEINIFINKENNVDAVVVEIQAEVDSSQSITAVNLMNLFELTDAPDVYDENGSRCLPEVYPYYGYDGAKFYLKDAKGKLYSFYSDRAKKIVLSKERFSITKKLRYSNNNDQYCGVISNFHNVSKEGFKIKKTALSLLTKIYDENIQKAKDSAVSNLKSIIFLH